MDPLKAFYNDTVMTTAVQNFLIEQLGNVAITAAFQNGSVAGIKEAKELIDRSFEILEETYAEKKKPIPQSTR